MLRWRWTYNSYHRATHQTFLVHSPPSTAARLNISIGINIYKCNKLSSTMIAVLLYEYKFNMMPLNTS